MGLLTNAGIGRIAAWPYLWQFVRAAARNSTGVFTPQRRPCWQSAAPGRITATGLRGDISGPTAKRRTRITDIEWIDIRGRAAEDARTGRLMLESKAGGEFWHELTFTRADVLAEFPVRTEQAQSVVKSAKPKTDGIARVIPKCPPMSQRIRYSLWQGIMDEFPDGVPVTMTVPDVARQLTENALMISRGIKKKNLIGREAQYAVEAPVRADWQIGLLNFGERAARAGGLRFIRGFAVQTVHSVQAPFKSFAW